MTRDCIFFSFTTNFFLTAEEDILPPVGKVDVRVNAHASLRVVLQCGTTKCLKIGTSSHIQLSGNDCIS